MKERQYLSGYVSLRSRKNRRETLFEVREMIGEGAACVSYEAKRDGKWGVLKEFWPFPEFDNKAAYALDRRRHGKDKGQLMLSPEFEDSNTRFREVQKEFEDCHLRLQAAIEKSEQSRELGRFFPSFEIYRYVGDGEEDGTTYLWFEGATVRADMTFGAFCRRIHGDIHSRPEYNLAVALHAVLSLTQCVRLLHGARLLHRDIKPENFGFLNLDDTITTTSYARLSKRLLDATCCQEIVEVILPG